MTWGGVPFHARRAMTVAAATLVVAGPGQSDRRIRGDHDLGFSSADRVSVSFASSTVPVTVPSAP